MLRFIDLRPAEIEGVRFAFWRTDQFVSGSDQFVSGTGAQGWGTWQEFADDRSFDSVTLFHFIRVVPAWVHEPMSQAEAEGVPTECGIAPCPKYGAEP